MTTTTTSTLLPPGALLDEPSASRFTARHDLWGFGGLHGGLTLGLLTAAMHRHAPDAEVQSVTARFHRPVRDDVILETASPLRGRTTTTISASASTARGRAVDASAVLGHPRRSPWPITAPTAPAAPPPEDLDVFAVPTELVPIAAHVEVRPVGTNLPFAGGTVPELTAWLRLVEDDTPPDVRRFVLLADALAPSYAAVMTAPDLVPTVELTVRPSPALAAAASPWVLVRATTRSASAAGWIDEVIDAWGPDGVHLGSAHQLRVVVAGS